MEVFKEFFIHSYLGGIFWILFGLFFLKSFIPKKKDDNYHMDTQRIGANIKAFGAGVGGILLGVIIIVFKLLGKL